MLSCNLVEIYGCFGGTCRLHRHGRKALRCHVTGSCGLQRKEGASKEEDVAGSWYKIDRSCGRKRVEQQGKEKDQKWVGC